jgi:hypothetical protein
MDDKNVYISFSILDSITNLITIPVEEFDMMISEMYNGNMSNHETHPAYDYIEHIYDDLRGMDIITSTFMLENIGLLKSTDKFIDIINSSKIPKHVIPCIYMYFITRKKDNKKLIDNFKEINVYDNQQH